MTEPTGVQHSDPARKETTVFDSIDEQLDHLKSYSADDIARIQHVEAKVDRLTSKASAVLASNAIAAGAAFYLVQIGAGYAGILPLILSFGVIASLWKILRVDWKGLDYRLGPDHVTARAYKTAKRRGMALNIAITLHFLSIGFMALAIGVPFVWFALMS